MSKLKFLAFMFLLPTTSLAAEGYFVKYMVSAKGEPSVQKGISIGRQGEFSIFATKTEGGFWVDNTNRQGATGSAFFSGSIGVEPRAGSLYVNLFQGVAVISSPDTVLGGPLQFVEDFGIGIRDKETETAVGFFYKHVSSAGIFKPNLGRDFMGLQVMIPW